MTGNKLNIITATSDTDIYEVTKITAKQGVNISDITHFYFREKDIKKVAYFDIEGYYDEDTSEKDNIRIYFDIPDTMPEYNSFIEMINTVIGTNNEYGNSVAFHTKFHEHKIKSLMGEIFVGISIPKIEESQFESLRLNRLQVLNGTIELSSENDVYNKEYPSELKWMRDAKLEVLTRKMKFRFTHSYEWHEANVDHEKLFAFCVNSENIADDITKLFPTIKLKRD